MHLKVKDNSLGFSSEGLGVFRKVSNTVAKIKKASSKSMLEALKFETTS
jgi:hypothetical protein